MDLQWSTSCEV